jgi:hypothetical protein
MLSIERFIARVADEVVGNPEPIDLVSLYGKRASE